MDLNKYKVLLAAADLGSFTKAAQRFGYTPSGVTHMMNALENELGFAVLTRTKNGVQLTRNGELLIPLIREILSLEEDFAQTVSHINGLDTGSITIGSYSSFSIQYLPNIIKSFRQDYPSIHISIMEGIRQEVVTWLESRRIDIGFLSYQPKMPFDWTHLYDDPMLAILPPEHPLANAPFYPLEASAEEDFIMPACGNDIDVMDIFRKAGVAPNIRYETFENYATLSMIESGLGMSIMNELATRGLNCDVAKVPLKEEKSVSMGIAVVNREKLSPAARRFVAYTEEYFNHTDV